METGGRLLVERSDTQHIGIGRAYRNCEDDRAEKEPLRRQVSKFHSFNVSVLRGFASGFAGIQTLKL